MKHFGKITGDDNDSSSDNEKMLTFQKELKIFNDSYDENDTMKFKNKGKRKNSDSEKSDNYDNIKKGKKNIEPKKHITYLNSESEKDEEIEEKNNVKSMPKDSYMVSGSEEMEEIPNNIKKQEKTFENNEINIKKQEKTFENNEIKKSPSQWTVDEMCENISEFFQAYLRKNKIDGKKFLTMSFENQEIGISYYQNHLVNLEENCLKLKENKFESKIKSNSLVKNLLVLNYENKDYDYEIKKTCIIGRSEDCDIRILKNKNVSKIHAIINKIDSNYYIKNNSSINGTFIKLMLKHRLKIYQDMCLDVGSHFIKILSLSNFEIQLGFSTEIDFSAMQTITGTFGDGKKIIFGRKPPTSNDNRNIKFSDDSLANQHGVFTLIEEEDYYEIELTSLKHDKEIWFKLEIPDRSEFPFCRLIPNMRLKISEENFIVKDINLSPLKKCLECNQPKSSVYLDCFHSIYCFDCAKTQFKKKKKCEICQNNIQSIQEIIDISI